MVKIYKVKDMVNLNEKKTGSYDSDDTVAFRLVQLAEEHSQGRLFCRHQLSSGARLVIIISIIFLISLKKKSNFFLFIKTPLTCKGVWSQRINNKGNMMAYGISMQTKNRVVSLFLFCFYFVSLLACLFCL
jgi:hypothetical protein